MRRSCSRVRGNKHIVCRCGSPRRVQYGNKHAKAGTDQALLQCSPQLRSYITSCAPRSHAQCPWSTLYPHLFFIHFHCLTFLYTPHTQPARYPIASTLRITLNHDLIHPASAFAVSRLTMTRKSSSKRATALGHTLTSSCLERGLPSPLVLQENYAQSTRDPVKIILTIDTNALRADVRGRGRDTKKQTSRSSSSGSISCGDSTMSMCDVTSPFSGPLSPTSPVGQGSTDSLNLLGRVLSNTNPDLGVPSPTKLTIQASSAEFLERHQQERILGKDENPPFPLSFVPFVWFSSRDLTSREICKVTSLPSHLI
jgi:hypothetical protein